VTEERWQEMMAHAQRGLTWDDTAGKLALDLIECLKAYAHVRWGWVNGRKPA